MSSPDEATRFSLSLSFFSALISLLLLIKMLCPFLPRYVVVLPVLPFNRRLASPLPKHFIPFQLFLGKTRQLFRCNLLPAALRTCNLFLPFRLSPPRLVCFPFHRYTNFFSCCFSPLDDRTRTFALIIAPSFFIMIKQLLLTFFLGSSVFAAFSS